MALFGRALVALGLLSLVHAGYSAIQYRNYLKLIEEDFTTLPADITIQILLSLTLSVIGIVSVAGDLKDIHAAAELANNCEEEYWEKSLDFAVSIHVVCIALCSAFMLRVDIALKESKGLVNAELPERL